jgi:hypothetical protein
LQKSTIQPNSFGLRSWSQHGCAWSARGAGDALALIGLPALVLDQDGAVMWANRLKSEIVGN